MGQFRDLASGLERLYERLHDRARHYGQHYRCRRVHPVQGRDPLAGLDGMFMALLPCLCLPCTTRDITTDAGHVPIPA